MPFIAERSGETVIPEAISDGEDVVCTACGDAMRPRGPFTDGTARHFYHRTGTDCSGGESDTHRKWKSLAVSALRQQFSDQMAMCAPEVEVDTEETLTASSIRRADALLRFEEENPFYGKGIIVEVQYKNEAKDVQGTTHDYLATGYSVYWADDDSFGDDRFHIDEMLSAFNNRDESAEAPYYADPPAGVESSRLKSGPLNWALENMSDYRVAYSDPYPDRDHDWIYRMVAHCYRCGLERHSSLEIGGDVYLYDPEREPDTDLEYIERGAPSTDHSHRWEGMQSGSEGEQLECRCGAKRTHQDDTVTIDHGPAATWDIDLDRN